VALTPSSSGGASSSGGSGVVVSGSQTADISTTATTYGTGADVLTSAISFTANGTSNYLVACVGPGWRNSLSGQSNTLSLTLDGAQGVIMSFYSAAAAQEPDPLAGFARLAAPAAGVHTVNARLFVSSGTGLIFSGTTFAGVAVVVYVLQIS
jgi:hypothetical protein